MDVAEEVVMGSSSNDHHLLVVNKGKRTKRQRPCSPVGVTLINNTSTSSSEEEEREAYYDDGGHCLTTTSAEFTTDSTEEEEDMANCLILLAQGYGGGRFRDRNRIDEEEDHDGRINRRMMEIPATTTTTTTTNINGKQGVGGYYVYKCKTCNRCFPSFQALGGHRASHKKPKSSPPPPPMVVEEKNKALALLEDNEQNNELNRSNSPSLSLHLGNTIRSSSSPGNNNKSKVHECSICGSEFSSGQALGGHMRRHRPSMTATTTPIIASESQEVTKKERSVLSLDLNLPAPEDDTRDSNKFSFSTSKQQPLVFSASALVDCHY